MILNPTNDVELSARCGPQASAAGGVMDPCQSEVEQTTPLCNEALGYVGEERVDCGVDDIGHASIVGSE